ncbi:hypothetical protein [Fodinibius salsisoli]|uniref:DUF4402 domain-containing protein n=1 Tax=Fodinibius salsisoli TaxID=2820877 RepID=A0ABT3PMA4_9BACT|nr:hypothetical protein [Fodinibius salsisoli]MCW9706299.1 hypothetical protein [Fodinibius salsisoli]
MIQKTAYLTILMLSLLLMWPGGTHAQAEKGSVHIRSTAVVVGDIELETVKDLAFQQNTITDSTVYIDPVHDYRAGELKAYGVAGATFRVTFLKDMTLYHASTPDSLQVSYEVTGYPENEQQVSKPLDALGHELRLNEEGEFYFWVGGTVQIGKVSDGKYNGAFTLEVEYN